MKTYTTCWQVANTLGQDGANKGGGGEEVLHGEWMSKGERCDEEIREGEAAEEYEMYVR